MYCVICLVYCDSECLLKHSELRIYMYVVQNYMYIHVYM